ncbi:hypothetical protein Cni_G25602 [Canna indica]|uniref:Uncharacterized protein n=1 Tax=Canna indica TaxID=4628 RepID=A0AAQ3QMJ7_9LILI|nr:hypothetical protein Cni_G25602 [Canna indica]
MRRLPLRVRRQGRAPALAVVGDGVGGVAFVVARLVHLHHVRHARLIVEYCDHIDQLIFGRAIIGSSTWGGGQVFVDCRKVKKKHDGT